MLNINHIIEHAQNRFVTVTFEKKDGTTRTINGRFNVKKHLKGGKSTLNKNKYFVIYSIKDEGYRAIAKDKVKAISTNGMFYDFTDYSKE